MKLFTDKEEFKSRVFMLIVLQNEARSASSFAIEHNADEKAVSLTKLQVIIGGLF